MITITSAVSQDAPTLANIMKQAWCAGFRGILTNDTIEKYTNFENCTAMFKQILASGEGSMYLARMDGKPAGLLYWIEDGESLRIEALLTIPEAWGRGVGAALIESAIADSVHNKKDFIRVWPFAANVRARRFYEKWGFTPTGAHRIGDAPEMEYIRNLH